MTDIAPLATIQPYPSKSPWFDISQYLTAGRIVVPTRTGQDPAGTTQIGFVMTGWRAA